LKVGGKLIWRSLATNSHSVARLKLRAVEREERSSLEADQRVLNREATFGDALAMFETALTANHGIREGSKLCRQKRIAALLKSWPSLRATKLAKIAKTKCEAWAGGFARHSSATVFNNTLGTLRMVLDIQIFRCSITAGA